MNKRFLTYVLFVFIISSCGTLKLATLQKSVDEISAEYVPDKRTGISIATVSKAVKGQILLQGETLYPAAKEEMIRLIREAGGEIIDSLQLLPEASVGDKSWGLIAVSVASIRTRPSHPAEMATQAVMGTPVRILKKQHGWFLVQTPDEYLGWTTSSSVQGMTWSALQEWRNSDRLIFKGLTGNVLSNDHSGNAVSDLVAGVIVKKTGETGSAYFVSLPDGRAGQVTKADFADFSEWKAEARPDTLNIPQTALRFLGLPYMWGGTSAKALDCSGYTKTVYFLNGMILERDASQQIRNGHAVNPDGNFRDLQPGDLLFYGNRDPFRVVHVGIWLGDSKVIHASGTVKVESMDTNRPDASKYLTDTFLGEVRRICNAPKGKGLIPVKDHPWY